MTLLATQKFSYKFHYTDGSSDVLTLEKQIRLTDIVGVDKIFNFGSIIINGKYVTRAKLIDQFDEDYKKAIHYARSLDKGMSEVAVHRCQTYYNKNGFEMGIDKLQRRLQNFIQNGKKDYPEYYNIYISAGGNPDHIS